MARCYGIPRDNKPETKNIVACEKYWSENYPAKLDNDKERPRDAPSVFACVKQSKVPKLLQRKRSTVKSIAEAFFRENTGFSGFFCGGNNSLAMNFHCNLKNVYKVHAKLCL